jgi:dTDP-4-amino-4,6-dideoxygalactose transaminase
LTETFVEVRKWRDSPPQPEARSAPLFAQKVAVAAPLIPPVDEVLGSIRAILTQSCLTNGPAVEALEQAAASYLGVRECVAVSSCTAGLMLTQRVLGLRGEVIVPSFTFCATAHSLLWNGLQPVFVDCDAQTFNAGPEQIEHAMTRRTCAILGVHIFGCPAPVRELQELASRRGIPLLFDGAHAFGAWAGATKVGVWGDATVFSLSPTKPLVAGEGGLIATADSELAARLRLARNYGKESDNTCSVLGLSARLTEMQAALALSGLRYVEWGIQKRAALAERYQRHFREVPGLRLQRPGFSCRSSHKDFAIVVDEARFGISRHRLEQTLAADNIETRRYFDPPLHLQPIYRGFHEPGREPLPVTERISAGVLCLPLHAGLEASTVDLIAERVLSLAGAL